MAVDDPHRVVCRLDELLSERGMTLAALSAAIGVSVVNLSVLKNQRARAIRFSTLTALCEALRCTPGELFAVAPKVAPSSLQGVPPRKPDGATRG